MRKAQAAMEFLMTYGWAILVVLVAISSLAYFGVLSPEQFLPEKCIISTGSGLFCEHFSVSPGEIKLRIRNILTDEIEITQASISKEGNSCNLNGTVTIPADDFRDLILDDGATCNAITQAGEKLKGAMSITFTKKSFPRTTTGSLVGKITEAISAPSCGNGTCELGDGNCPADVGDCTDDICSEPVCNDGCSWVDVAQRGTDEACQGITGCSGSDCFCDGSGNCVECINAGDCGAEEICLGGICIASDYVAYWKFDEQIDMGTYNMTPDENGVNNGTLTDNAVTVYDSARNYSNETNGYVLSLDGDGDYVEAGNLPANGTTGITWSLWVKGNSMSDEHILDQRESNVGYQPVYIGSGGNAGDIQFYSSDTADNSYFDTNLQTGQWYHIAMVLNGSDVLCYIDGSLNSFKADTQYDFGTKDLHIGIRHSEDSGDFNGAIDEVMIYDRALNETEIQEIHNTQNLPPCAGITECSNYTEAECPGNPCDVNLPIGCKWNTTDCVEKGVAITESTDIIVPGTYFLTVNITDSSTPYFINISANDVILDCQGNTIDGDGTATALYGIYINRSSATDTNITIENCILTEWYAAGVYLENSNKNSLEDLNLSYYSSIVFFESHDNTINNAYIDDSNGISLINSDNNKITNSYLSNGHGIILSFPGEGGPGSNNNQLTNITANSNDDGIYILGSSNNNLTDITANSNNNGIYIRSSNNILTDITANSNSQHGIYLFDGADNNQLTNITANSNTYGIRLRLNSNNNQLTNAILKSNTYGIHMNWDPLSTSIFNALITDSATGMVVDGLDNNIQFVTINGSATDAIEIYESSVTGTINDTLITHCSGDGVDNSIGATLNIDYIANYSCAHNGYSGANDVPLSSDPYDPAPTNGNFYLLQSSEAVDAGSVTSANAVSPDGSFNLGTYYTTNAVDTGTVDIGYHYPAAADNIS